LTTDTAVGGGAAGRFGGRTTARAACGLAITAGFFLGAGFFSALRATTGRAAFFRGALRAARLLTVFFVLEALETTRFRAAGRAVFVERRRPFLRTAAFRRSFFCTAFLATLRTGRARRNRPAPWAAFVAFRAVARALLRLAIA
jgi:hypothetical protein